MKDKRTYLKLNEHGEDISHENERKHSNEHRGPSDLTYLIETHQQEIYGYKEAMGKMQTELTVLRGSKKIIEDMARTIQQLRDRVREAEGETSIVKGIGMNSPEMRAMQQSVKELKDDNKKLSKQIEDLIDRNKKESK